MPHPFFEQLKAALLGTVRADEPLARHTSWRVGGPAELFVTPAGRADLAIALRLIEEAGIPWLPLGAGSNLLVRDGGIRGAVLHSGGMQAVHYGAGGAVTAEAGVWLPKLVQETVRRGLGGLEELAGIPGTVGGAAVMNAGAGNSDLAATLQRVHLCSAAGEEIWDKERCAFGYRCSALPDGRMVTTVELQLQPMEPAQLALRLEERLAARRSAQAVGGPNAGSVFKNPPGHKAWQLIDAAGWRGRRLGGAQVAEQHANFIINCGGATARDILGLIDGIRSAVLASSGIELEPEVRIVGHD